MASGPGGAGSEGGDRIPSARGATVREARARGDGGELDAGAADAGGAADAIERVLPDLEALGADPEALRRLAEGAAALRGDGAVVDARLDAEFRMVLRQIEQLELQLADNASAETSTVDPAGGAGEVSEAAAEYYRRLSERPSRAVR